MKSIPESDVIFGPYDEKDLFHIEKSELYKSLGEGLKTVEFILRASTTERGIVFVEAKSNGSNPEKKMSQKKNVKSLKNSIRIFRTSLWTHWEFIQQLY